MNHNSKTSYLKGNFNLLTNQRKQHRMTVKDQERRTGLHSAQLSCACQHKPSPCLPDGAPQMGRGQSCRGRGSTVLLCFCMMGGKLSLHSPPPPPEGFPLQDHKPAHLRPKKHSSGKTFFQFAAILFHTFGFIFILFETAHLETNCKPSPLETIVLFSAA